MERDLGERGEELLEDGSSSWCERSHDFSGLARGDLPV